MLDATAKRCSPRFAATRWPLVLALPVWPIFPKAMRTRLVFLMLLPAAWTADLVAQVSDPAAGELGNASDFIVRPGDLLRIRVWPDATLSGDFPVEDSGIVYLPVLGPVDVAGIPLDELRRNLRLAFAERFLSPVISITPVFQVAVLGGVLRPGLHPATPSDNLFDVLSLAGGFTENAQRDKVTLIRGGQVFQVALGTALETGGAILSTGLRSGDRIIVPVRRGVSTSTVLQILQSVAVLVTLAVTLNR